MHGRPTAGFPFGEGRGSFDIGGTYSFTASLG
jgi:hypothetical protein